MRKNQMKICMTGLAGFFVPVGAALADAAREARYIPDAQAEYAGMTLWQIIAAGGGVMIALAALSVTAVSLTVYYFLSMKRDKLLPQDLFDKLASLMDQGKINEAMILSEGGESILCRVFYAGAAKKGKGPVIVKETMEDEGRRQIDGLWQRLSYLADIAAIAPMVGLLGTVLGMIQAFNVIAFQAGAVKPVLLASGISKAMVTTAAGLIIAVPSMLFYAYFRGVVRTISARLENQSTELYHMMETGIFKGERK